MEPNKVKWVVKFSEKWNLILSFTISHGRAWNKYMTYEKLKIISSSGICKIIYYNGSYLLLPGKRNKKFEIS